MDKCPFEILGLEKSTTLDEIDRTYRQLMLKAHPDKKRTCDSDDAQILNDARERAKRLHASSECAMARQVKDDRERDHLREVTEGAKAILDCRYHRRAGLTHSVRMFERMFPKLPDQIQQEAQDLADFGLKGASHVHTMQDELQSMRAKCDQLQARNADLQRLSDDTVARLANELRKELTQVPSTLEEYLTHVLRTRLRAEESAPFMASRQIISSLGLDLLPVKYIDQKIRQIFPYARPTRSTKVSGRIAGYLGLTHAESQTRR